MKKPFQLSLSIPPRESVRRYRWVDRIHRAARETGIRAPSSHRTTPKTQISYLEQQLERRVRAIEEVVRANIAVAKT